MAVTTTPRQILTAAYSYSTKNRPGVIASESTELLQVVIRAMRGLFAFAARVNPTFFAESASVAFAGTGWPRPEGAESVFRVEQAGVEVAIVPYDDRGAEAGMPALYRFGQVYRPATAGAPDPQSGNLTFFYSKRPTSPATLDATVDPLWVEQFNELLALEVAIYLSVKDGRTDELASLLQQRDKWIQLFVAFLEHETANERRRFGHIHRINVQTLVPLLAGGQAVAST